MSKNYIMRNGKKYGGAIVLDNKVKQNNNTTNGEFPVLLAYSVNPTTGTSAEANYNPEITVNPATGSLKMKKISASQSIEVGGATITHDATNGRLMINIPE